MEERVILVDRRNRPIGTEGKMRVHRDGRLHRAFSVFVFDEAGSALLLQQRAAHKYHSAGLWANTCCSHPRPGETTSDAAHRRLQEEMGFVCPLRRAFGFVYRADLGGGVIEHEYDHVFVGRFRGELKPNADEVAAWRWAPLDGLSRDVSERPDDYAVWFRISLPRILKRRLPARFASRWARSSPSE